MSVLRLDDVVAEVLNRSADSGIRIIGVDGPQGSGKTTLAARIAARIRAPLIQIDDFVSRVDLVGWWPRFEAQVLDPLLSGGDAHYQLRDWENDEFGTSLNGWKTVEWSPVVVLEGLTCTRAAVADRLAYRIWVEAPDAVRLRRGLERDGERPRALAGLDDHRAPVLRRRRNHDKGRPTSQWQLGHLARSGVRSRVARVVGRRRWRQSRRDHLTRGTIERPTAVLTAACSPR